MKKLIAIAGIATLAALFATSIAARLAVLAEVDCNL